MARGEKRLQSYVSWLLVSTLLCPITAVPSIHLLNIFLNILPTSEFTASELLV